MAKTYLATRADISDMATNTNLSAHKNDKNNPHSVTATQLGAEVTSNRTDDIASNAEDSSRYPSTKGVADYVDGNYLPLTGGTLSGDISIDKTSFGGINITNNTAGTMAQFRGSTGGNVYMRKAYNNEGDGYHYNGIWLFDGDIEKSLKYEYDSFGNTTRYYNIFGEHNYKSMPDAVFRSQQDLFTQLNLTGDHTTGEVLSAMLEDTMYKFTHNHSLTPKISDLPQSANGSTYGQIVLFKGYNDNNRSAIYIKQNGTQADTGDIYIRTISTKDTGWVKVQTESNKPTGTYTGTGSSTTQSISVGGSGSVLVVTSASGSALVTPNGATAWANSTGDYYSQHTGSSISASEISYSNGVLRIASTNGYVNNSGTTYTYQVL